jgi:hypothetical protein
MLLRAVQVEKNSHPRIGLEEAANAPSWSTASGAADAFSGYDNTSHKVTVQ